MWHEKPLDEKIIANLELKYQNKQLSKKLFQRYLSYHEELQNKQNDYQTFSDIKHKNSSYTITTIKNEGQILGDCPVASNGTRCCNLLTLDAVQSCGFDCSYCSIQSFYNQNNIGFDENFKQKLQNIKLDKNKIYHIGTGQSSDSLMWGNKFGILDELFSFAKKYPNVILEFKTKSNNITYFLENVVPKNIIVTWSLNTPTIIKHEEHLTASLNDRVQSARKLSDKGVLVGFHFHPIVEYKNSSQEYRQIYKKVVENFSPNEVVMVSFGTLTFIKPLLKKLRQRDIKTKITQMKFEYINNKKSYDKKTKTKMFKTAYDSFASWHSDVYFYLCMEDFSIWRDVFGYEYISNNQMEEMMNNFYMKKINNIREV